MEWVQVFANLREHDKTCNLRDALKFKTNYEAVGVVVSLWLWAAINAPDGNLSKYRARDVAKGIDYPKPPDKLVEALLQTNFLDKDEEGNVTIHDWEEHAALFLSAEAARKEKTRQRVQRYRERNKQGDSNGDCNVTDALSNAPTVPNRTLPNLTVPNHRNNLSAGGEYAPAREATEGELLSIGIHPGEYYGIPYDVVVETHRVTYDLYQKFLPGRPLAPHDYKKVFRYCGSSGRAALLGYAFEQAALAGKPGDWRYIDGIMEKLFIRGITTEEQARRWDEERPDLESEE